MKTLKRLFAFIIVIVLRMPNLLAQDEGTYIENLNIQDSSYMQQNLVTEAEKSGSNTIVIVIVAVVVIAVVAFLILRKKKK